MKPASPGQNAGIHHGDRLLDIDGVQIERATDVAKVLVTDRRVEPGQVPRCRAAEWNSTATLVVGEAAARPGGHLSVRGRHRVPDHRLCSSISAAAARRRRSISIFSAWPVSSSLCFHYTGKLNTFDKVIYFGNLVAGLLAPTVFLHFCLTFPEPRPWFRGATRTVLLYVPAALMFLVFVAFSSGAMKIAVPLMELRWMLDRVWMVFVDRCPT